VRKIDSDILIKADSYIPIEIKSSALSLQDAILNNLPFIITVCIVAFSAFVTYCISKRNIESQREQSINDRKANHENKVSEFRERWLQDVRNTASLLLSTLYVCQHHNMARSVSMSSATQALQRGDQEGMNSALKDSKEYYELYVLELGKFHEYSGKLKLFFNDDDASKELFKLIKDAGKLLKNQKIQGINDDISKDITLELQKILKTEWEVTKNREWST
jgi:hypothetical protein